LNQPRSFHDNTLAQSAMGRKIIGIYFNNAALERSPTLRAFTRMIAPMLGKKG
jgi:hypothetical protein